jgi:hypothetical protein
MTTVTSTNFVHSAVAAATSGPGACRTVGTPSEPMQAKSPTAKAQTDRSVLPGRRRVAAAGAAIGAVLYSNWLLQIIFTRTLPNPDEFISELAAGGQPHAEWFRGGDRATAVVCLIAVVAALVRTGGSRWSRMGWWLVGVFAVSTALDSTVFNMTCAPSADAACASREAAGAAPIGDQLHLLSSAIAVIASILSLIFFVMADRVEPTPAPIRRVGRYMVGVVIGTQIWTGIAFAIDPHGEKGQIGIAQQASLIAMAGWLIYVALRTAYAPTKTARQPSPSKTLIRSFGPPAGFAAGHSVRHAWVATDSRPGWASNRPRTAAPAESRSAARCRARSGVSSTRPRIRGDRAVTVCKAFVPETKESDNV